VIKIFPACVLMVFVGASCVCLCPAVHGRDSSPEVVHSWWGLGAGYACKPCPVPLSPLLGCYETSNSAALLCGVYGCSCCCVCLLMR
jgi:hypothetical protein